MIRNVTIFSKMTFAVLSQATAESQRLYYRTQNTFNRIQNSLLTIEIHDQGKLNLFINFMHKLIFLTLWS